MAAYVAELHHLAEHCNYGDSLDMMLQDRLVLGINDGGIQKKLLQENDLLTLARSSDCSSRGRDSREEFEGDEDTISGIGHYKQKLGQVKIKSEPIQRINAKKSVPSTSPKGTELSCHCCGHPSHLAPTCRFKDYVCNKCKKRGHLARVCHSKSIPSQGAWSRRRTPQPVQQVYKEVEDNSDDSLQSI